MMFTFNFLCNDCGSLYVYVVLLMAVVLSFILRFTISYYFFGNISESHLLHIGESV